MKLMRLFILLSSFLVLTSFIAAQDFQGVKWGMTRQQVTDKSECKPITPIIDNAIAFKCETRNNSLYSSLEVYYCFDEVKDSLTSIILTYNDAGPSLYTKMKSVNSTKCGDPVKRNDRYYWRSKDRSYVLELSKDGANVGEVIAQTNWKFIKGLDFSKKQKTQSDDYEWQTVQVFRGKSIETTDDFSIESNKWRINWKVSPTNDEISSLFFGAQLVDNNGHSEFFGNASSENHGTSVFRNHGTFYLKITASNANWEIEIQEYSKL